jgi:hypothetical protein
VETPSRSVRQATLADSQIVFVNSSGIRVVHRRLQTAGSADNAWDVTYPRGSRMSAALANVTSCKGELRWARRVVTWVSLD